MAGCDLLVVVFDFRRSSSSRRAPPTSSVCPSTRTRSHLADHPMRLTIRSKRTVAVMSIATKDPNRNRRHFVHLVMKSRATRDSTGGVDEAYLLHDRRPPGQP